MKHTPGPWISDGAGYNCDRSLAVIDEEQAWMNMPRVGLENYEYSEANDRLIAAAPEHRENRNELN